MNFRALNLLTLIATLSLIGMFASTAEAQRPAVPPVPAAAQNLSEKYEFKTLKGNPAEGVATKLKVQQSAAGTTELLNQSNDWMLVNGHLLAPNATMTWTPIISAYVITDGEGCFEAKTVSDAGLGTLNVPVTKLPHAFGGRNNITVPEIKLVDPQFIRQKLNQAAQALATLTPWNATAITNQYGATQGSTNTNSYFAGQLTTAGTPQVQSTYNTGQPSTTVTSYNGQCPANYYISAISGTSVTCTAVATPGTTAMPSSGSLNSTQVTTPSPSLQTQLTTPSFVATVPTQPTATGALTPSSTVAPNPYDILSQQVELNSELVTYQALFSGLASDNSYISNSGQVGGARQQVTLAFPVSVSPFAPYKGAVAEVRVFMIPSKAATANSSVPTSPLSVVNLLPASNTYNVAQATTNTKQFGAGVTLDLIGVGASGGKTKSTLYLAKDTDTIALQYANPIARIEKDVKKPITATFRELLPVGECEITSTTNWTAASKLADEKYDLSKAIIFGWQFKPVLGNEDLLPIDGRLFFAQIALDAGTDQPILFVETRWRAYDRKTGVVGNVYKDSCTWEYYGPAKPLEYASAVTYLTTDDLGGGNLRVKVNGYFTDPNLQVRMGNTQRAPDSISTDLNSFEFYTPANTFVAAPDFETLSEGDPPLNLVSLPAAGKSCAMDASKLSAEATPHPDGTATVNVHLTYGQDRVAGEEFPLVLFGTDVYGLHDHPFLPLLPGQTLDPKSRDLRFSVKLAALSSDPAITVKDVNWSNRPVITRIRVGPTFTSMQSLVTPTKAGGAGDDTVLSKGPYEVLGTGFESICAPDENKTLQCLSLVDATSGTATPFKSDHFQVLNDQVARLVLDQDTKPPLLLHWTDTDNQVTEWSLATKPAAPPTTPITADKSLKKGDSLSVVFSGQDFSGVSIVSFEETPLTVLAKDTKSITVLVTTKVTASPGSKDLIATGGDGKPIVLPLIVTAQ